MNFIHPELNKNITHILSNTKNPKTSDTYAYIGIDVTQIEPESHTTYIYKKVEDRDADFDKLMIKILAVA